MNHLKPITPANSGLSTEVPSMLGWNVDVSPASSMPVVEADDLSEAEVAIDNTISPPRRGLSRLAPKTDGKPVKRRERLQKIRGKKQLAAAGSDSQVVELSQPSLQTVATASAEIVKPESVEREPVDVAAKPLPEIVHSQVANQQAALPDTTDVAPIVSEVVVDASDSAKKSKSLSQAKRQKKKSRGVSFTVTEPPPQEEESYTDWLRRVVLKHKWVSVVTTFYVHWLLILALAALLVNGPEDTVNMLLNASFAAEDLPEETTFDVTVPEPTPIETSVAEPEQQTEEAASTLDESEIELDESVLGDLAPASEALAAEDSLAKQSDQPESNSHSEAIDRSPPQAVRKGSFSVWTEPSSPQAGEPYRIIIQVCLPDGMKKYNVADLQGVVVGSDGYRKPIPGYLRGFLPIEDGYARLIVPIVTADEKVQDTIFIRSRILKETQKLLLEFESDL